MYISQDHDDQKTIARLKNAGFKYMIIDTNTASIDKTPGKTLTAKYQDLIRFIQKNPQSLHVLVDEPQNGIMFVQIL
jgi:diphthamide synthase (EF-2-diphthine--ammonia ligase)